MPRHDLFGIGFYRLHRMCLGWRLIGGIWLSRRLLGLLVRLVCCLSFGFPLYVLYVFSVAKFLVSAPFFVFVGDFTGGLMI